MTIVVVLSTDCIHVSYSSSADRSSLRSIMDIREAPSVRDWPPIRMEDGDKYGQFVLLRLDPIESVAHLEDEWATQEASQIPGDLCLAVVFGVCITSAPEASPD